MLKQFTATVYILERGKVLLIYHRKLGKWLPPGGHLDEGEIPPEAAKREALEETGLHVELWCQENIWVEQHNANSFPRPYMCLLENIPAWGDQPEHQHIDFIYVGKPIAGEVVQNDLETNGIRWFTAEEIGKLIPEEDIFQETIDTIMMLFKNEDFACKTRYS